jgi:hypothetical protein
MYVSPTWSYGSCSYTDNGWSSQGIGVGGVLDYSGTLSASDDTCNAGFGLTVTGTAT